MESSILPKLFGLDARGKEREWSISVEGNKVIKSYGVTGGKMIISEREFEGKNIGKKNETTDEEQALLVAQRDWISQINEGYAPRENQREIYDRVIQQKNEQGGGTFNLAKIFGVEAGATKEATKEAVKKAVATKTKKQKFQTLPDLGSTPTGNGIVPDFDGHAYKAMLTGTWEYEKKCTKYFNLKGLKTPLVDFFAYIQPKLDGIRCLVIYDPTSDKIVLLSREGKQFTWLNHLRQAAYNILKPLHKEKKNIILDCEVYATQIQGRLEIKQTGKTKKIEYFESDEKDPSFLDKDAKFQFISGAVKTARTLPHLLESQLQLHVFDIIDLNNLSLNQEERLKKRDALFDCLKLLSDIVPDVTKNFVKVETLIIHSENDIEPIHNTYIEQGYEGVVLRAKELRYQFGVRSNYIRKHKNFVDAEFEVIGINYDAGTGVEQFTWKCKMADGTIFKAKPLGNKEMKEYWFENYEEFVGKKLTVRYQDLSAEGIPRFPRGIAFREEGV